MKPEIREIIGRRIAAVYLLDGDSEPRQQLYLVFDDGTYYELYGPSIGTTAGVKRGIGRDIEAYAQSEGRRVRFRAEGQSRAGRSTGALSS